VWKKNVQKKKHLEWRPTSSFLMEKYMRNRQESVLRRLGGYKHERSPAYNYNTRVRYEQDESSHGLTGVGGRFVRLAQLT
jgi:hypothetical protein